MTDTILTLDPSSLGNSELHGYMLSAVAPRPIAFASTVDKDGNVNLSPFSYFNVFSTNPPIMIFSPARRGRDNSTKDTYDNVKQVSEVCINIVNFPIVEQMSLASTEYEKGINEFIKAGFTEVPSDTIKPPRVKESPVSFECTVEQVIELGQEGGAGNLVLSRVQRIHIHKKYLDEFGKLDSSKLDLVGRMGANWYSRANLDSMFEIPRPSRNVGMGVDQLPRTIRESTVLSANDVGRLGNVEHVPAKSDIEQVRQSDEVRKLLEQYGGDHPLLMTKLHELSKARLEEGNKEEAFSILMIGEEI